MAPPQTYSRIRSLTSQISQETRATKRRDLCKDLREFLGNQRNRETLLKEAKCKQALVSVWTIIIDAALQAADKAIQKSKSTKSTKANNEDVAFPYHMLVRLEEFTKLSKTDGLLPSKQVRQLLNYCLIQLADDASMEAAGVDLFAMLDHLCSRPDFVMHFRIRDEMEKILADVEEQLAIADTRRNPYFESAAKAFASLLNSAKDLGMGMYLLIPKCLAMIGDWCQARLEEIHRVRATGIVGVEYMFSAAAAILSSHPEHAIYALSVNGGAILSLAKQCYPIAPSKASKEAIIEYFLAHLLVCQTAGRLQGLLPGDLGDVGDASLDKAEIDKLIAMTVTTAEIDKVRMGAEATKSQKKASRTPIANREPSMEPTDLSRCHFELCARLLAFAQRQYLSKAEWDTMKSPVDDFVQAIPEYPRPDMSLVNESFSKPFESCSISDFVESPFISMVGLPLWSYCDNVLSRDTSQLDSTLSQGTPMSATSTNIGPRSDIQHFAPVLKAMSDKMYDESSKSPVPFLQLVCALAETFPLGQCWTSNTQRNWHAFTPDDLLTEDKAYCNGCSPDDIALVVSLVTNILEAYGGPNGDVQTQRWALTCLIRLSESSALVALAAERKGEVTTILHVVWQRVWNTLFRTDLRYASYTSNVSSDTVGELVIVLLTEIVKSRCTDPTTCGEGVSTAQHSIGEFIHANQSKVWNLEAFSNAATVTVPAVFDLISAIVHFAGISEDGRDLVDGSGPTSSMRPDAKFLDNIPTSSRRFRLVSFCLRFLEMNESTSVVDGYNDELSEVACSCLLALFTKKATPGLSTFDKAASIGFQDRDTFREFFCVTNIPVDRQDQHSREIPPATFSSFLQCLWCDRSEAIPKAWLPDLDLPSIEFDNSELTVCREMLRLVRSQLDDHRCDFVSPTVSAALHQYATECMMKISAPPGGGDEDDQYEFDEDSMSVDASPVTVPRMVRRISVLKLLLSAAFSREDDKDFKQPDMDLVETRVTSVIDEIVRHFPTADQDDELCVPLAKNLLQVLQALSVVSLSVNRVYIPETISVKLDRLFFKVKALIHEYGQSRVQVPVHAAASEPSERKRSTISFDDEDDFDDERKKQTLSGFDSDDEDDDEEEDDDEFAASGSKRRRSANSWGDKSKKLRRSKDSTSEEDCKCPTAKCAKILASILVLIQPSYGVCRMIAEAIALSQEDDGSARRGQGSPCDTDVDACIHCLNLFCSPLVIHRNQNADLAEDDLIDPEMEAVSSGTIITLCHHLVQDIRNEAGPGSNQSLFGFEVGADLVHQRENEGDGTLESQERHKIVDILIPENRDERKVLKGRPKLRMRQLVAATSVFRDGKERMHKTFAPRFKTDIIGQRLRDLSASVRKEAGVAVGAALRAFTEQANIARSVKKNFPPLNPKANVSLTNQFQKWWCPEPCSESGDTEDPVWRELFFSMQRYAVEATGVIAGSTTQDKLFRDYLFEIVLLAAERPDLEALCYQACEKTAGLVGFETVQQLFISECEYICERWLLTGKPLVELPLLFTAPTLLFQFLQSGSAKFLVGIGAIELSKTRNREMMKDKRSVSLAEARTTAAHVYIDRSACFLVPIICMKSAARSSDDAETAHAYLEEVTDVIFETRSKEDTRKLLRSYFADILAFVEPLLHCVDKETVKLGEMVVSYLKKLLPEDDYGKLRKRKARDAIQQLLCHWGKGGHDFEIHNLSKEAVHDAVMDLANDSSGKRGGVPFASIGSSVTEYILHGRFWLSQSVLKRQKERRWSAIELVFSLVLNYIKTSGKRLNPNSQLGYCIHTILDILADPTLSSVYPPALETLNGFLSEVFGLTYVSTASPEMSPVFYRLIGTLVKTHERHQDALIEQCLSSWLKHQGLVHRSSGLRRSAKASRETAGDMWGWDAVSAANRAERIESEIVEEKSKIDETLFGTLTGTYDALERSFRSDKSIRDGSVVPIECLSKFASQVEAYTSLHRRDRKLCARSLADSFLKDEYPKTRTVQDSVSAFLSASNSLLTSHIGSESFAQASRGVHDVAKTQRGQEPSLSTNFTLLLDELYFVQNALEGSSRSPLEFIARSDVSQTDRYALVNLLLKLCEPSYPEEIRAASSRCFGALGPSDVDNLASAEFELSGTESELGIESDDDDGNNRGGNLLTRIKCSCLVLLSQYLLSPRPETALAALQAAKAILSSDMDIYNLVGSENHRRLLDPLVPTKQGSCKPKLSDFVTPDRYLDGMLKRITIGDVELSTDGDPSWCWHDALWTSDHSGSVSYEDWVMFITCAMVSCCFVGEKETNGATEVRGSGLFFRYCIKLCALEHDFAAKAFPGIILDLLLNGIDVYFSKKGAGSKGNANDSQSLASCHLSRCFTALLESASSNNVSGKSAPPKVLSLAVDTIDMIRVIMQKKFEASKLHKKNRGGEESTPTGNGPKRQRIPNGIVLRLNGLSVARACMKANRFASALFYADMHAEKCYGRASGVLERLANGDLSDKLKQLDISGFDEGEETEASNASPTSVDTRDGGLPSLPSILHQSFSALRDTDAADAVNLESSAMNFLDDGFKWNASNSVQSDALERLKALDLQCQDKTGRIVASQRVLDCMEDIGLEDVLQTYTAGLVANQGITSSSSLSTVEQSKLRDQWFHGRLKSMQWDGEIFSTSFPQEPPHNIAGSAVTSSVGFHEGLSKAMSSFMTDDVFAFRRFLSQSRSCLIEDLSAGKAVTAPLRGLVDTAEKLQFLNDIERLGDEDSCKALVSSWHSQNEAALGDNVVESPITATDTPLRLGESVTWARELMLRTLQSKDIECREDMRDALVSHLWQIGSVARLVGRSDYADSTVQRLHAALHLKHMPGLDEHTLLRVRFEEAMIMESRGDFSSAIRALKLLYRHLEGVKKENGSLSPQAEVLYADALLSCGEWSDRYKVETGKAVMLYYLQPAKVVADSLRKRDKSSRNIHRSFAANLALAKLTSGLFESACKVIESPEWAKAGANIAAKQSELDVLRKAAARPKKRKTGKKGGASSDMSKDVSFLLPGKEKELASLMNERSETEGSITLYLRLALKSYCHALIHAGSGESSDVSTHVYRLISLWFENSDHRNRTIVVNEVIGNLLGEIPSFRFVPLAYQIFSRLASGTEEFQTILKNLVLRMCAGHPYHCIVQLLALANGEVAGSSLGAREYKENVDAGKVACAKEIIDELKKDESPFIRDLTKSYDLLVQAYSDLALVDTSEFVERKMCKIPVSAVSNPQNNLRKLLGSRGIASHTYKPCVITQPPVINPLSQYGDGIEAPAGSELIERFDPSFEVSMKGASRPKILFCHGSNGTAFKQVVKGNDDMRGDAVMQQVFCFVNDMMKRRNDTSKRMDSGHGHTSPGAGSSRALKDQLKIVTYHIVPLSPATGVMEFVNNSITFGEYIVGSKSNGIGAHSRYNPGEWSYHGARKKLEKVDGSSFSDKRTAYDTVCEHYSPSFRHFFTERFGHSLPLWYAARTKYTRSCAVNSIVGHVLGIGDRHIFNILIQENTGELVHIDFGIVFEQGKLLRVPETVPFRLSRDIVDGMGPCGTDGTFSRTAEETTLMLRENTNALLTILSAIVSDPLYKWNLTPKEARKRQQRADVEEDDTVTENEAGGADNVVTADQKNQAAVRAIARIQEKLSGTQQSVQGEVQLLINEARDVDNLCRIFSGWSPHV